MDWIGRTVGKVTIESLLARGGMAEVYLGTHTTLQRKVAVKILRQYQTDDLLRPLERFELEARAVARLRHPNIVQVFDYDSVEDQPYLVMEYISGPSLSKYLAALHARNGRLGLPLVSQLLTKIASALQYAHDSGVIHRDVKPSNILLTSRSIEIVPGGTLPLDMEPVLSDFGLVRFLDSSRQTASGLITGTPAYMSPEQAMGEATDGRTDIYSLGIVLYEMLSARVPFDGESTMSILLKHLNETPAPVPGLSPPLQQVLDRSLAKSPADRFQSPLEFATAFNTALEGASQASTLVTIPQVLTTAKSKELATTRRQKKWIPVVLTGMLLTLLGGSFLFNGMLSRAKGEESVTPSVNVSDTPLFGIPVTMGPGSVLHLQDGDAILDQATLIAQAMPAPPPDSQYKVWLVGEDGRLPLGTLRIDGNGQGELTYSDPQDENLLAKYFGVEITIEPISRSDSSGPANVAYAYSLPTDGLAYMRGLMVSFPGLEERNGLLHGLVSNAELINEAVSEMLDHHQNNNPAGVKENAESIMNLLVGNQSPNHKDWNKDGKVTDPGDGYGLLLNRDHLGYIQAVYSNAEYAVNSSGATRNIIVNGENVKICTQNLALWVPELRDHVLTILEAQSLSRMDTVIERSAELADQILNGIDLDENGEIDPVANECGVLVVYQYTYQMADMPLLPVTVNPLATQFALSETVTPTPTGTPSSLIIITPTRRQNDDSSPATVAPDDNPPGGDPPGNGNNPPKPTKKPKDKPPSIDNSSGDTGTAQENKQTKKP
jgi:serine/threonine protein kinase